MNLGPTNSDSYSRDNWQILRRGYADGFAGAPYTAPISQPEGTYYHTGYVQGLLMARKNALARHRVINPLGALANLVARLLRYINE